MAGGGQAAQMVATGVIAGLSRTGPRTMERISAVSGNSGGTWIMDGLIASQSFYDSVTAASDDNKIKSLVGSMLQDFKTKVSDPNFGPRTWNLGAGEKIIDGSFAKIMKNVKDLISQAAKVLKANGQNIAKDLRNVGQFIGKKEADEKAEKVAAAGVWSGDCANDAGRLLYPMFMGISYGAQFHTFAKKVIEAYYPELRGSDEANEGFYTSSTFTFNSASSTLALTAFGKRVRATYTTAMAPTTWAYAKDPYYDRAKDWFGLVKDNLWTNKIYQQYVAHDNAPREFKAQMKSYGDKSVAFPLAFSKPPQRTAQAKAGWVYSKYIARLELRLETTSPTVIHEPTTLKLPDDPSIEQVTAMSSAAGGGLLSTDTLATKLFCPKEILSIVRGSGISVSGIQDSKLNEWRVQPEWSKQARFVDGGYADNTGFAFGIAQMQADLGGVPE